MPAAAVPSGPLAGRQQQVLPVHHGRRRPGVERRARSASSASSAAVRPGRPRGPVDRDRRAVVGLEVVAEVLGAAEQVERTVWRLASTSVTRSPSSARTWSSSPHSGGGCATGRRRRGVRLHGGEHLPDEAFRRPAEQADGAARAAHPDELVGAGLVVRREHDADAGHDGVELAVGERQRLGVGLPPVQPRPPPRGLPRPASSSSGVRSQATTLAPASAAGIAALPDPAATSSTRSPGRISQASTRTGPSSGMRSVATAG